MLILNVFSKESKLVIKIMVHTLKNIKITFLAVLLIKFFLLIINLAKELFFAEEKMLLADLLKQFFKSMIIVKKMIKNHFNKNLMMSAEEEERFQLSNSCWICDKLFDVGDDKVRDHSHITGKYRGAAHWSCNINLKLTKKIPVIFHNLRGYDSHLIIKEISKFDIKVNVRSDGLEKCMAFTISTNLVFIDKMQFMNSSLNSLVKNLSGNDLKYLSEEFSGEFLGLVKQKECIYMNIWTVLGSLLKINYLIDVSF